MRVDDGLRRRVIAEAAGRNLGRVKLGVDRRILHEDRRALDLGQRDGQRQVPDAAQIDLPEQHGHPRRRASARRLEQEREQRRAAGSTGDAPVAAGAGEETPHRQVRRLPRGSCRRASAVGYVMPASNSRMAGDWLNPSSMRLADARGNGRDVRPDGRGDRQIFERKPRVEQGRVGFCDARIDGVPGIALRSRHENLPSGMR